MTHDQGRKEGHSTESLDSPCKNYRFLGRSTISRFHSNVEFKNCNKSFLFASLSWSPLSFLTLSLICSPMVVQNANKGKAREKQTHLLTSKYAPSFLFVLVLLALFALFASLARWTVPYSYLFLSVCLSRVSWKNACSYF
jgi:hypothetical protein